MSYMPEGSGQVSAVEQAKVAYNEMRRSLVKFASEEALLSDHKKRGTLTPMLENIIVSRAHAWRDRAAMFALVYQVETDVATRNFNH